MLTAVTLAAGMVTAVPVSAEAVELTLGTDYTVAAYYDKDGLINGDQVAQLNLFEKNFNRDDKQYYVSYIVFDISAVDVDKISYSATAGSTKSNPPIAVYYTDGSDIVEKTPSAMGATSDLTGEDLNYSGFRDLYSFNDSEISISYTDNGGNVLSGEDQDISAAKDAKYLVLACRGWSTTTFSALSIIGTRTAPVDPSTYVAKIGDNTYSTLADAINAANGTTATIEVLEDCTFSGMSKELDSGSHITINAADGKNVTITREAGTASSPMFRADKGSRSITLGAAGGTLNIVDNSTYSNGDARTLMVGSEGNNVITLGQNCVLDAQGDVLLYTWGKNASDKLVINGANVGNAAKVETGNGATATTIDINGNATVSALNYNIKLVTPDVTDYTGNAIPVSFQNDDAAAGMVVAIGTKDKLSYESDTLELAAGTDANVGKVVLAEKATEPTAAPSANFEAVNFESDNAAYTASGNTLKDKNNSENIAYGYKAELSMGSTSYNGVKAYVKVADGDDFREYTYDGTVSGNAVFYVVTNKAIDTDASKVYCE